MKRSPVSPTGLRPSSSPGPGIKRQSAVSLSTQQMHRLLAVAFVAATVALAAEEVRSLFHFL